MSNPTGSPRRLIRTCVETSVAFVAAYGLASCGLDGRFSSGTVPEATERPSPKDTAEQTILTTRRSSSNQTFQPSSTDPSVDSGGQATSELSSQAVGALEIDPDTGTLVPAQGSMGTGPADAQSPSGGSTQTAPDGASETPQTEATVSDLAEQVLSIGQLQAAPQYGLRRLTRSELTTSIEAILGTAPDLSKVELEAEAGLESPLAGTMLFSDIEKTKAYWEAITTTAERANVQTAFGCQPAACTAQNVRSFLQRAFRRASIPDAIAGRYLQTFADLRAEDPTFALRAVIQDALLSADFLYLSTRDTAGEINPGYLANRTSFFIAGKPASPALLQTLSPGSSSEAQPGAVVEDMWSDPSLGSQAGRFVRHWLRLKNVDFSLKGNTTAGLETDLPADMDAELSRYVGDTIVTRNQPMGTLLTRKESFVNSRLAGIYGLEGSFTPEAFALTALPEGERQGLLTMPAVLFNNSKEFGRSPMQRGKFMVFQVLCHQLPNTQLAAMAFPPGLDPSLSLRDKFKALETGGNCAECHRMLNAGFAFDGFDPLGKAWDASVFDRNEMLSSYTTFYGKTLSFTDPVSAADQLASLPDTYMCIAQKATEYALGRPLAAPDQGALEGIFAAFAEARFTWKGLTTAIVNSPLFKEM